MKVLVLGHGKRYLPSEIYAQLSEEEKKTFFRLRCSPPGSGDWWNHEHTSVDINPLVIPDIFYDLNVFPWNFCEDETYDVIIDASGTVFIFGFRYTETFLKEVLRCLKTGGIFYGIRGNTLKK